MLKDIIWHWDASWCAYVHIAIGFKSSPIIFDGQTANKFMLKLILGKFQTD